MGQGDGWMPQSIGRMQCAFLYSARALWCLLGEAVGPALRQGGLVGRPGLKALHPGLDFGVAVDPETRSGQFSNEAQLDISSGKLISKDIATSLQRVIEIPKL